MTVIINYLHSEITLTEVTHYVIKKKHYMIYEGKLVRAIIPTICPIVFLEEGKQATNT